MTKKYDMSKKCQDCPNLGIYEDPHHGHPDEWCNKYDTFPSISKCNPEWVARSRDYRIAQLEVRRKADSLELRRLKRLKKLEKKHE